MSGPGTGPRNAAVPDAVGDAVAADGRQLISAFCFSAAMSVLALTSSFYMLQVYDRVLSSRSTETLFLLTLIAVAAICVNGMLDSLRQRLLARTGMRVGERLAALVMRGMVAATSQTGGQGARTGARDIETVRNFIASPALLALMDAPYAILYFIVLFMLSPFFLLVVVIGAALLVGLAFANQRLTSKPLAQSLSLTSRSHTFAEDGLRNADVLEGMGMSAGFVARWRATWLESLVAGSEAVDRDSRIASVSKSVRQLIQIVLLGVGALLILDFQATGGIMIGATIIGGRALAPIEALVGSWKNVIAARLARDRLNMLLAHAPKRDTGMPLPPPVGRLQVQSASYLVPATRRPIVANISFELEPGESLGIIGPSGCGKSTLLRLIVGAWPCTAGIVRLDGADIYAWPRGDLSPFMGYLPQDVELFSGTVRDNIARMGAGDPVAIAQAAQRAGAHDMILSLPKGYETEIGINGHDLSGGQSQRVGIARALYGNPCLVVLDEPNANLDRAGEEALLQALADLKKQIVTVVIVAHRPSIISSVDKILVLRANGSVEAFGPRQEVLGQFVPGQRQGGTVVPITPPSQSGGLS